MKVFSYILIFCITLPCSSALANPEPNKPSRKFLTAHQNRLLKYFALSCASSYGSLYLIARTSGGPVAHRQLISYAIGIPTAIGLGLYLGVLLRVKPFATLLS